MLCKCGNKARKNQRNCRVCATKAQMKYRLERKGISKKMKKWQLRTVHLLKTLVSQARNAKELIKQFERIRNGN